MYIIIFILQVFDKTDTCIFIGLFWIWSILEPKINFTQILHRYNLKLTWHLYNSGKVNLKL